MKDNKITVRQQMAIDFIDKHCSPAVPAFHGGTKAEAGIYIRKYLDFAKRMAEFDRDF